MYNPIIKNEFTELLVEAFVKIENKEQAYRLLEDLCTIKEIKDLSQRISVAKLLRQKTTYTDIEKLTNASSATISRVNRALNYGANGYNILLDKIDNQNRGK